MPSLADVENVPLQTRARGRNLAELLGIIGVVLPNTRDYSLHAQLVKDGDEYRFTHLAGRFGDSDLAGRLTVTNGERLRLDSVLATRSLDIVDAAPFIGYNPDIVASQGRDGGRRGDRRRAATHPARRLAAGGGDAAISTPGSNGRSRDDQVAQRADLQRRPDARARSRPARAVAADLRDGARQCRVGPDLRHARAAGGRTATTSACRRRRWAACSPATASTNRARRARSEARIQLEGRGDTIHDSLASATGRIAFIIPAGSFWTRNVQLSELDIGTFVQKMFEHKLKEPVQINCGLIGFTVRDGIAAADPIMIDTKKNVILGRGGFSFKNESARPGVSRRRQEVLVLLGPVAGRAERLFRRARDRRDQPGTVGRAGAGLGLAIVASPLAAVLAFVDIGDAKSAQCGPVLAGAHAAAMRTKSGKPRDDVGNGTTAKSESGKESPADKQKQKKKFLGIF